MDDLLEILQKAKDSYGTVSSSEIRNFANTISEPKSSIKYDWDEWSGENWLTLTAKNERVAMIGVKIPVAFIATKYGEEIQSYNITKKFYNVIIDDFDKLIWFVDLTKFKNLFSELEWHASVDAVNTTAFSTNELWFATI